MKLLIVIVCLINAACAGIPEGLHPVTGFEVKRYTGKWYEIARLDNWFEQGLEKITAEYSLSHDGGVSVTNSGFNVKEGKREYAYGRAYFTGEPDVGSLKVSFFGPFYGGYYIIELDKENYNYVLIAGSSLEYLWILARQPELNRAIVQKLKAKAESLGFDTANLVYPKH